MRSVYSLPMGRLQSLLLEGRGRYNCSNVPEYKPAGLSCNQSDERCAPHVWSVERGKTYRLRLASVASLSSLNFKIEVKFIFPLLTSLQSCDSSHFAVFAM